MTSKIFVLALAVVSILSGCGAGPQPLAQAEMKESLDSALVVRQLYDASEGDFDKVPADGKKKLIERFKSEDGAKKAFAAIKSGPGAALPTTTPGQ